jgi:prophage regulatory protein
MVSLLPRILRQKEVSYRTGLARTTLHRMVKNGEFPAPIPLNDSGHAKGWFEDEILEWQKARLALRGRAQ